MLIFVTSIAAGAASKALSSGKPINLLKSATFLYTLSVDATSLKDDLKSAALVGTSLRYLRNIFSLTKTLLLLAKPDLAALVAVDPAAESAAESAAKPSACGGISAIPSSALLNANFLNEPKVVLPFCIAAVMPFLSPVFLPNQVKALPAIADPASPAAVPGTTFCKSRAILKPVLAQVLSYSFKPKRYFDNSSGKPFSFSPTACLIAAIFCLSERISTFK